MKKVMILGVHGMAGNMIYSYLSSLNKYSIVTIARTNSPFPVDYTMEVIEGSYDLEAIISKEKPDIIINCIGVLVKYSSQYPIKAYIINSLFPKYLATITHNTKTKIIHLSTDCVFSGTRGNYLDTDMPDGIGPYASTKSKGEIRNDKDLTIRMSIIGPELKDNPTGLFGWFMAQSGKVKGFSNCMWSGITTLCLAQNIDEIIGCNLTGLYQLTPNYKISKYKLLKLIQKVWKRKDITILADKSMVHNKTLLSSHRSNFKPIMPENYEEMLKEMKEWEEK